mmetsp:Transcript_28450/g.48094  ORF Transcript_28450/g.48094 Transcript_28450/m.48094 type:complete len:353 (+) Transcript_28450:154-1212(+)
MVTPEMLLKLGIILMLALLLAGEGICFQYSRQVMGEGGYSTLHLVAVSEVFKMCISAILLLSDTEAPSTDRNPCVEEAPSCVRRLLDLLLSGRQMILLVALYLVSNLCSLYATATVGATISTLFSQLKILSTALCGKFILGKQYSTRKWVCLWLLMFGCTCVSYPVIVEVARRHESSNELTSDTVPVHQKALGMLCLAVQVSISGIASVYFELVLKGGLQSKGRSLTIWERNFQLAAFSVTCAILIGVGRNLVGEPAESHEWTALAGATALCQGGAGIFVAATLKHADAVLKCFANSLSIIVVTLVNVWMFGQPFEAIVKIGILISIGSMFSYALDCSVVAPSSVRAKPKTS